MVEGFVVVQVIDPASGAGQATTELYRFTNVCSIIVV
jgi:hypothetical protein